MRASYTYIRSLLRRVVQGLAPTSFVRSDKLGAAVYDHLRRVRSPHPQRFAILLLAGSEGGRGEEISPTLVISIINMKRNNNRPRLRPFAKLTRHCIGKRAPTAPL